MNIRQDGRLFVEPQVLKLFDKPIILSHSAHMTSRWLVRQIKTYLLLAPFRVWFLLLFFAHQKVWQSAVWHDPSCVGLVTRKFCRAGMLLFPLRDCFLALTSRGVVIFPSHGTHNNIWHWFTRAADFIIPGVSNQLKFKAIASFLSSETRLLCLVHTLATIIERLSRNNHPTHDNDIRDASDFSWKFSV